jgi:hypothetical protein
MKKLWDPPPGIQASGSRCAARRSGCNSRTVLGGKGSLRRAKSGRALASCAPFCGEGDATGCSAGNQMQSSFFVLAKTKTRWQ